MPTYDNKPAHERNAQPQKSQPEGQGKNYKPDADRSKDAARKDGKA